VVANHVFCRSCGYIPCVCRHEQWWMHRYVAQIPGFTKSLCIHNHTQSGWDRPKSYSSKPCGNNSEVIGIDWAAVGICQSCPARSKQSTAHMVPEYWSWWIWYPRKWSLPTLWSGTEESASWLDESTDHHYTDDFADSAVLWGLYNVADREWRLVAVWWTIILDC